MSDGYPPDLPPAPPEPAERVLPVAPTPASAVEPWQARLEVVALLLLVSVVVTVLARLAGAYDQARVARTFDDSVDLVRVVQTAGEQVGLIAAGAVLVAFLLVTLGPGSRLSGRSVLALRVTTVVGLVVAGVCAFAGIAALATDGAGSPFRQSGASAARTVVDRLSTGVPLLLAAGIAGYVAWCAFSTLGEEPRLVIPEGADERGELGAASEGRWEIPPTPPAP